VLIQLGWKTAAWISLLRVLCGSLLLGTFLSPTFILSLGGAVCSIGILWLACHLPGRGFGPVGFSILAALAHMTGQFILAFLLFIPNPALWGLFPVLLTAALLFGTLSGIIAGAMTNTYERCKV
jgi:heptaprenyl diphosphate synthase